MAFIDATSLNVILPSLQREFNATGADLFWVLNSYLLMLASLIIVGGSLGDKLGRVKIFKLGIFLFTVGSICCGFAPDILLLVLARIVQGIGGALMIPGSLSIISAVFSKQEKGKAIGTWSAATTIVTVCGPVLGGALADVGLWRYIFFMNVPLGLVALAVLHYKVPESYEPGASKIDWYGALMLTLCLALLSVGFLEMPVLGYVHWLVSTCLVAGVILLIVFVWFESRIPDPMVPLTLFRSSTFSGVNLLSFFLYAALGGVMLFLSLNLIQVQGYSQLQAGLTFTPFSVTMILLARLMGSLSDKYGYRWFLVAGPMLTGIGMAWLASVGLTRGPSDYWVTFFPGFLVFAIGMSVTVVPLTTAVMGSVAAGQSGIASGINNSVTRISGTFINAILGAVAIFLFSQFVMGHAETLSLTEDARIQLSMEAAKLGEAQVPTGLAPAAQDAIREIYRQGFIATFRFVGWVCAALAWLAALIAFFTVKDT